jgi:hypothetical protein
MPARESSRLATLKRRLKDEVPAAKVKKFHSSGWQRDIDLMIIVHGQAVFWELKRPGAADSVKPHQRQHLAEWATAGALTGAGDDLDALIRLVKLAEYRGQLLKKMMAVMKPIDHQTLASGVRHPV